MKSELELIDEAIEIYKPVKMFALFSGGHDSLTATHLASKHPRFDGAVHINTGIGIAQTRQFVRDTCKQNGWPLTEYSAKALGYNYREIVIKNGFPGSFAHLFMYSQLKERAIRVLIRENKTKWSDKILLITGVRSGESIRRMRHTQPIQKDGAKIWVAPIHNWSKSDCNEYIDSHNLKRNLVVDLIHMSGECLCGAFAKPGELKEIEYWFPETAAHIKQIEKEVRDAGHNWGWEEKPPNTRKKRPDPNQMMLCFSCEERQHAGISPDCDNDRMEVRKDEK